MNWDRPLLVVAALRVAGGGVSVWDAFQRQMCTSLGGATGQCSPNVVYLIPGILLVLVGIGFVAHLSWRRRTRQR